MEIGAIIAENLKQLREERGLSLGQLSELCGVSKVMLSQIQRGEANPSINTLWKIANGLKTPYTALLEQRPGDASVVRRHSLSPQSSDQGHDRLYCHFSTTPTRNFELFEMELDAHSSYISEGHSQRSEEYVLLVRGALTITVCDASYDLGVGDSLGFTATGRHIYENAGAEVAAFVIVNYYPV